MCVLSLHKLSEIKYYTQSLKALKVWPASWELYRSAFHIQSVENFQENVQHLFLGLPAHSEWRSVLLWPLGVNVCVSPLYSVASWCWTRRKMSCSGWVFGDDVAAVAAASSSHFVPLSAMMRNHKVSGRPVPGDTRGAWGESDVSLTLSGCVSANDTHKKKRPEMAWLYILI